MMKMRPWFLLQCKGISKPIGIVVDVYVCCFLSDLVYLTVPVLLIPGLQRLIHNILILLLEYDEAAPHLVVLALWHHDMHYLCV